MKILKKILIILILISLTIPAFQGKFKFIREKKINGYFKPTAEPRPWSYTFKTWLNAEYQTQLSTNLENYIGLRNHLFVLHNQYDYSLFGLIHSEGFISGKEGMLYEEDYLKEYNGDFFIGAATLDKKLNRLKEVRDKLKEKGTELLVVFEPGKASFYPEFIPDQYHAFDKKMTNYEYMAAKINELSIPFLDLNKHFLQMKDTSRFPLFPKYGMHWSIYGMATIVDTFSRFVEKQTGKSLPSFRIGKTEITENLRYSDNDIGDMLNLILPLPKVKAAYPEMIFEQPAQKDTLKVLVIADSYYANLEEMVVPHLFGKDTYWYYNSKVFPHIIESDNPVWVDKTNLDSTLATFDVVLLMSSEINLHCVFWNFPDEAWLAFNPDYEEDPGYLFENRIRNEREWFRFMSQKAKKQNRSLEDLIRKDALYSIGQ